MAILKRFCSHLFISPYFLPFYDHFLKDKFNPKFKNINYTSLKCDSVYDILSDSTDKKNNLVHR